MCSALLWVSIRRHLLSSGRTYHALPSLNLVIVSIKEMDVNTSCRDVAITADAHQFQTVTYSPKQVSISYYGLLVTGGRNLRCAAGIILSTVRNRYGTPWLSRKKPSKMMKSIPVGRIPKA